MANATSNNYRGDWTLEASRKRKERDFDALKASISIATASQSQPDPSANRLLAGYLAHEFLSSGTLLGQRWDPARADAKKPQAGHKAASGKPRNYADVAALLKTDGAHIPGIVNPSQLVRWLGM